MLYTVSKSKNFKKNGLPLKVIKSDYPIVEELLKREKDDHESLQYPTFMTLGWTNTVEGKLYLTIIHRLLSDLNIYSITIFDEDTNFYNFDFTLKDQCMEISTLVMPDQPVLPYLTIEHLLREAVEISKINGVKAIVVDKINEAFQHMDFIAAFYAVFQQVTIRYNFLIALISHKKKH